jgi:hypothetical protein
MANRNCGVGSMIDRNWCRKVEVVREKQGSGGEGEYVVYLTCATTNAMSGVSHHDKRRAAGM